MRHFIKKLLGYKYKYVEIRCRGEFWYSWIIKLKIDEPNEVARESGTLPIGSYWDAWSQVLHYTKDPTELYGGPYFGTSINSDEARRLYISMMKRDFKLSDSGENGGAF